MNTLRNHFIKASLKPIPPLPEYYIQYTSTGGSISPAVTDAFGSNIIDNYYDDYYNCYVIVFDNPIMYIGALAFYYKESLTSLTIPNSVTSIGEEAFYCCRALASIIIPESVTSIGNLAFFDCRSMTSIVVDKGNIKYDSRENCNAIIETATNTLIRGCNSTVIPDGVTSIGERAFEDCRSLTSITIPNSVTHIGNNAFRSCISLTSINISNSIKLIGNYVFRDCKKLTSITIPDGVTSIGDFAFYNCSSLTSITFNGTKEQWKGIKFGGSWKYAVKATVVHCTDGDVTL